jgi:predicted RNA-binding Zn ribbon-like protein
VPTTTAAPLLGEPLPVELMNTLWADRDGVHDALTTDAEAAAWVSAVRSADPRLADCLGRNRPRALDVEPLRELRNALRCLAAARTADPRPPAGFAGTGRRETERALAVVNRAAAAAPHWSELAWPAATSTVRTSAGLDAAVAGAVAERAIELFSAEDVDLRACLAPGCVLYFVRRHTRREWCSAGCGNRARAARHYERHRDER